MFETFLSRIADMDNSVDRLNTNASKDYSDLKQTLKEKHKELKNSIERLGKLAAVGPDTKEFQEPKVKALWDLMVNANFSKEELDSLKVCNFFFFSTI